MYRLIPICLCLLMAGCASNVPKPIRTPVPHNPDLVDVRGHIDDYEGERVRWGGTIASVHTGETATAIEVVQHGLTQDGRPQETDRSGGRFIARVDGFLDPVIYARNRELTVTGRITGKDVHKIGDHNYKYPVVQVQDYHLWKRISQRRLARDPFYDPFGYDPWVYPRGRFFRLHGH